MSSPHPADARRELAQRLLAISHVLSHDELDVLLTVAEGMMRGKKTYGDLDLNRDRRDFTNEALEEVRDGLVYIGAALLQARRSR